MILRVLKAGGILGIGMVMTMVIFPWLDSVRDNWYHNVTPVYQQGLTIGDDDDWPIASDNWGSQEFIVTEAYRLDNVRVRVWRVSGVGTLTVAVYDGDVSHHPTGSALDSGTMTSASISPISPGDWEIVPFADGVDLAAGNYCVVLHCSGTLEADWRVVTGAQHFSHSEDGGVTWSP